MPSRGLVIGKFYPPHRGHKHLIDTAMSDSAEVHVIVCDRAGEDPPATLRARWIREIHPGARVMVVEDTYPPDDSELWARLVRHWLGFTPDSAYTSEDYGHAFCRFLGCRHVQVDKARIAFPVSGTMVRTMPLACWDYLERPVRAHYALRVVLQGAESTGKTTLSRMLAKELGTVTVPEFGRAYTEEKIREGTGSIWNTDDFVIIAKRQVEMANEAAGHCNRVVICDTDAFATGIWHRRYLGCRSAEVESIAAADKQPDLCILTDINTPFEQDGTRDGENIRGWMDSVFREELEKSGRKFIEVKGNLGQRLETSLTAIRELAAQKGANNLGPSENHPCGT